MLKIKKCDWRAIILLIVVFQILSLWCIDISISAMMLQSNQPEKSDVILTNGFITQNPSVTYHISLYWLIISIFLLTLIAFHHIDQFEEIEEQNKTPILNSKLNKLKKSIRIPKQEQKN